MVNSIVKTFKIMEFIASKEDGSRLSEIAQAFKMKPPTVHNLLKTMIDTGYVEKDRENYKISNRIFERYLVPFRFNFLWKVSEPLLKNLAEKLNETVVLAVLHQGKRRIVGGEIAGNHSIIAPRDSSIDEGLYDKPSGRLFLAYMTDNELAAYADQYGFPGPLWNNISSIESFRKECSAVREQGFAETLSPDKQVKALAVPVMRKGNAFAASLGMHMPAMRYRASMRCGILDSLRSAASAISFKLGAEDTV